MNVKGLGMDQDLSLTKDLCFETRKKGLLKKKETLRCNQLFYPHS